jgi:hypothetical protein
VNHDLRDLPTMAAAIAALVVGFFAAGLGWIGTAGVCLVLTALIAATWDT